MSTITELLKNNWPALFATVAGGIAGAAGDSSAQPSGWQGVVQRRPMQRSLLQQPVSPLRRPGSMGRRYFTDPQYQAPAPQALAAGGIASLAPRGYYLGGSTDGMSDEVPASIEGQQEAALSHGEFVIPADVVSHIGNGNSEAGAQQLYRMMERIRQARTGNPEQGRRIDPTKFMPT